MLTHKEKPNSLANAHYKVQPLQPDLVVQQDRTPHPLLQLQRQRGNRFVQSIISAARRIDDRSADPSGENCGCQQIRAPGRGLQGEDEEGHTRLSSVRPIDSCTIQRELATPPPAVAPAAQPDLTPDQTQSAIRFNRARYDERGTRLIQDLVGTTPTGTWTEDDIRAIAAIQETYGLAKDGKVGTNTFRFIDNEVRQERLSRTDDHCLVALAILRDAENIVPSATGAVMTRHFTMRAQFPSYCNCSQFEYRQFIRGHLTVTRAGVVHDLGTWFSRLPAGRLNTAWQEDGETTIPSINFGHRDRTSEADNRYVDDRGAIDMRDGCRYEGDDTPGGNFRGWAGFVPTTGDIIDIDVNFRGEVQRGGRVVRQEFWSALRRRFTLP